MVITQRKERVANLHTPLVDTGTSTTPTTASLPIPNQQPLSSGNRSADVSVAEHHTSTEDHSIADANSSDAVDQQAPASSPSTQRRRRVI